MENIITVRSVTKQFGNITAVRGMDFEVRKGEILGFLGPNGSGKTTTVRLLNGVLFPDSGAVQIKGLDTVRNGEAIRRISGVMTETAALYENMTARENLEFFAALYGVPAGTARKRADALVEQFGLTGRKGDKVGGFSTGMKKRMGIAKALVHDPEILFLDEPTSGLDPESARDLIQFIKKLNQNALTVFVCTHNLAEAEHFCTRFAFLDKGRIMEMGTLAELEDKYAGLIRLKVDYKGSLEGAIPKGLKYEEAEGGLNYRSIVVDIPARREVPAVVRAIASKAEVFSAQPVNSGLEALYFEIRRSLYE